MMRNAILIARHKFLIVALRAAIACSVFAAAATGSAQEAAENWGNDAARNALQDGSYPWYDSETDDLNPLTVDPKPEPAEAKEWQIDFPEIEGPDWNWNLNMAGFWEGMQWVIWGLMIGLLIGVLIYFIRSVVRDGFGFQRRSAPTTDTASREAEQIENLPFAVERPRADLLAEARHHYENGDYGRAIVYLFSYQLVHLDKHQLIRLAKGKTNRQYLRELGSPRNKIRTTLQQTMISFEDVFFGNHRLEKQAFEACWNRLEEFHQGVQQLAPATA